MQIQQEQQQKQIISQKMLESMEILQMSTEELSAYLKETALSNPVIELDN